MTQKITCRISRIFFSRDDGGWCAGRYEDLTTRDYYSFSCNGNLSIGDIVELTGNFVDTKYGRQFKADSYRLLTYEFGKDGIAAYLADNKKYKGVGIARAKAYVDCIGSWADATKDDHIAAAKKSRVKKEIALLIYNDYISNTVRVEQISGLCDMGLSPNQANKVFAVYAHRATQCVKEDPYQLIDTISGIGFAKADQIALNNGFDPTGMPRTQASIKYVLSQASQSGITRTPVEDCHEKAMALIGELFPVDDFDNISGVLVVDDHATITQDYRDECTLLNFFEKSQSDNPHAKKIVENPNDTSTLTDMQMSAYRMAIEKSCCCITGGAGTGKSYLIARIYKAYRDAGLSVALAAPTGKASMRIEESINEMIADISTDADIPAAKAQTIHRLLEYKPVKTGKWAFFRNENKPLDTDVVILDEVSMINVNLFARLVSAIDASRTSLLLVGDHNQLPPIGPGYPLRDILSRGLIPAVKLDISMRQLGVLHRACNQVLDGFIAASATRYEDGYLPWVITRRETIDDMMQAIRTSVFELSGIHHIPPNMVPVLSPYRKGQLGTVELNSALQAFLNGDSIRISNKFLDGDRVIQLKNNYDKDVFNGQVGFIEQTSEDGEYLVKFDNGSEVLYAKEDLDQLDLAYALTIHKVQGSQYPCVIVVLHSLHAYMNSRRLIYTAVTRAKKAVEIIGDSKGIRSSKISRYKDTRRTWMELGKVEHVST